MRLGEHDVVLVTGGASGLGAATVRRVVAQGASALIIDLPSSSGSELAAELGDRVRFAVADVRDEDQVQAAVAAATQQGFLRVVVNCAGVATPGRVIGKRGVLPLETFRTVIDINLVGTFNVLRLAAAAMIDARTGDGRWGPFRFTCGEQWEDWVSHVFVARTASTRLDPQDRREIAEARFVTVEELAGPIRQRMLATGRGLFRYRVALTDATLAALAQSGCLADPPGA